MKIEDKYERVAFGEKGCMRCGDWSEPLYDANGCGLELCLTCMEKDGLVEFDDDTNEYIVVEKKDEKKI